jgi:hypothetical protein
MIPIDELLNRIHWDPEFAKANFQLSYLPKYLRTAWVRERTCNFS